MQGGSVRCGAPRDNGSLSTTVNCTKYRFIEQTRRKLSADCISSSVQKATANSQEELADDCANLVLNCQPTWVRHPGRKPICG